MAYGFNDDKSKYKLGYNAGDIIDINKSIPLGGYLTNDSKTIRFTIPTKPILSGDIASFDLSIAVRHSSGGYPYMFFNKMGTDPLGPNLVNVAWTVGVEKDQEFLNTINYITAEIVDGGIKFSIVFNNSLVTNAGGTTRVINNVPVGIDVVTKVFLK